jgi:hypothetical protein
MSGQGQTVEDGSVVATEAVGEGMQVGKVVGVDGGQPSVQVADAGALDEHLGERRDVAVESVQTRTAGDDLTEPLLIDVGEVGGIALGSAGHGEVSACRTSRR